MILKFMVKNVKLDRKSNNHIFFYSRPSTPRRCFELGIEALRELYRRGIDFKLYTVGQEIYQYKIPFSYNGLGILEQTDLAQLYSNTDVWIGIISNQYIIITF